MAPAPRQKPKPGQSSLLSFFAPKAPAQPAPASSSNNGNPNNNTNADKKKIDHGKQPSTHHEHIAESLAIRDAKPDHADRPQGVGEKRSEELLESDNEDDEEAVPAVSRSGRPTKRVSYLYSDEDEEDDVHPPKTPTAPDRLKTPKRKRLMRKIDDEDDEDDDYQPEPSAADHDDDEVMGDSVAESMDEDEPTLKPTKPTRKAPAQSTLSLSPLEQRFKGISVRSPYEPTRENQRQERGQKFKEKNEQRYSWLLDIKDKDKNPIGSPDYDPRTLYVPASAWGKFTPFEKQYWEVKAANWDTIVFFKKGKFYELYEKDADVGHKDFDLKLTERVNMRMVGVPEMSFDYWAAQFIARGHKVAKVDQMETAIGKSMRERNDTKSKADKVIRRELTSVLTAGTLVDAGLLTNDLSTYCMSVKEYCPAPHVPPRFGICFVDSATAEFNLVTINDDVNRTKFETLVTQIQPRELVTEKNCLSKQTARILKNTLNDPIWNQLKAPYEFWDAMHTMDEIRISGYFDEDEESWPEALKEYRNDELVMSAIGGLVSYLRNLKLDRELLSAKNVRVYDPMQKSSSLVLDGQTLANLEIFQNSFDGSEEGTVFKLLNNCTTPFGKRLFRRRLCHPLRSAHAINERLDAVENFMGQSAIVDVLTAAMANLPDLERLISRVHSGRCKVKEFLATLDGFQKMQDIANELRASQDIITARLLQQVVNDFPDMTERLHFFKDAFKIDDVEIDYQKMRVIIPVRGVNSNWDALLDQITAAEKEFDEYLLSVKKQLKCAQICYKDMGKEIYQMEVPKGVKVPNDWVQLSSTSKVSRYWDSSIKQMVIRYKELLETKTAYIKNFTSEVYADFDKDYALWLKAVHHIAEIDVLMGLAKSSANLGEPACRPQIIEQETSVVEFEDLRHPCVVPGVATDFIPNDTTLGGNDPNIIVLTGPNMGGKSTILRQTCVAIIMAQLGCYVPARSCRLTPCDRIYTRIGANDNIMAGQSTFMVELAETSKILHEATPHSMVILDELGRGTSTFDGYAIAYAVLHYLATHVGCLGMFSTHYQTLCREFDRNPSINNMHMGYYMDEDENTVTFLYKLTPGICEKSFGMNVAHMAGVPSEVIKKATQVADQFESQHRLKDTTFGEQQQKKLSPSVLSDFVYLMSKGEDEDIGDVAEDMQTQRGRDTRNTQTMRRILKGLARAT